MYARDILSMVHCMHLRIAGSEGSYYAGESLKEIRAMLHSIPDPYDRREMVSHIRHWFQHLRTESGTEARWQDYMEKVEKFRAEGGNQ